MSGASGLWTSGLVFLALGAVAGLIAGLRLTRRDRGQTDPISDLDDAAQRQEHRVALLRDLEEQKDKLAPAVYAEQRTEYELLAAQALAERERLAAKLTRRKTKQAARGPRAIHPQVKGLVYGAAAVVVIWFVWSMVSRSSEPSPATTERAIAADLSELEGVTAALRANPADVDALVRGSDLLLHAGRFDEAAPFLERALQLDPEQPRALVGWAALRAARGDSDGASRILDRVVTDHPEEIDAWSLRGMLALQRGDAALAEASFTEFVARAPDGPEKERVRAMLNQIPQSAPATAE